MHTTVRPLSRGKYCRQKFWTQTTTQPPPCWEPQEHGHHDCPTWLEQPNHRARCPNQSTHYPGQQRQFVDSDPPQARPKQAEWCRPWAVCSRPTLPKLHTRNYDQHLLYNKAQSNDNDALERLHHGHLSCNCTPSTFSTWATPHDPDPSVVIVSCRCHSNRAIAVSIARCALWHET